MCERASSFFQSFEGRDMNYDKASEQIKRNHGERGASRDWPRWERMCSTGGRGAVGEREQVIRERRKQEVRTSGLW